MSNIFCTGSNGFLGKQVVERILTNGDTPIVLIRDRNRKTDQDLLSRVEKKGAVIYGDVTERELIRSIVSKYELDYIVHLAALPIVKICDADPWAAYNVNTVGTLVLLEAAREQMIRSDRLKKIIHMSTDKSYGNSSPTGGYLEDTPFQVGDTYSTSKALGDMIAQSYAKTYKLPISIVRCGNIYGGGDLNLSRLVPGNILRLLNGEQPVLYTDAGEMKREYIHVSDVVSAFMLLLKEGKNGEAYNIGIDKMYKTVDVINMIRERVNPSIQIKMVDRSFAEINEQSLNSTKLQALGWTPKYNLDTGLDEAVTWYKNWHSKTTVRI